MARPSAWHCGGHRGHSARNSDAEAIIASSESVEASGPEDDANHLSFCI